MQLPFAMPENWMAPAIRAARPDCDRCRCGLRSDPRPFRERSAGSFPARERLGTITSSKRKVVARVAHTAPALVVYFGAGPALGVTPAEAEAAIDPTLAIILWQLVHRTAARVLSCLRLRVPSSRCSTQSMTSIPRSTRTRSPGRSRATPLQVVSLGALYRSRRIVVVAGSDRPVAVRPVDRAWSFGRSSDAGFPGTRFFPWWPACRSCPTT